MSLMSGVGVGRVAAGPAGYTVVWVACICRVHAPNMVIFGLLIQHLTKEVFVTDNG